MQGLLSNQTQHTKKEATSSFLTWYIKIKKRQLWNRRLLFSKKKIYRVIFKYTIRKINKTTNSSLNYNMWRVAIHKRIKYKKKERIINLIWYLLFVFVVKIVSLVDALIIKRKWLRGKLWFFFFVFWSNIMRAVRALCK